MCSESVTEQDGAVGSALASEVNPDDGKSNWFDLHELENECSVNLFLNESISHPKSVCSDVPSMFEINATEGGSDRA